MAVAGDGPGLSFGIWCTSGAGRRGNEDAGEHADGQAFGAALAAVQTAGHPPTAEAVGHIQLLQAAIARAATTIAGLLVFTTAAMAVARYVP